MTQGGTGTLTATISTAQAGPTTIDLQSSDSSIASVPTSVTISAGTVTTTVTITALSPGTATITATVNGSTLQSVVTVRPAGPTLTRLDPATLQVAQGAAGTLAVTLSAAQATDTVVALAPAIRPSWACPLAAPSPCRRASSLRPSLSSD
ncbi:MAG TPA: hypothetical protein VLT62_05120 [Candidatus Methylomirabilis sp.]|nr:hypothetical protein [Candidatus Methylomirabilis sp.]